MASRDRRAIRKHKDRARYRVVGPDLELLEADFEEHVFERHYHETYAIGVTLRGVQRFRCGRRRYDSTPGDVMVIPPGEVHDGESGSVGGYAYRMFYVRDVALRDLLIDAASTDVTANPRGGIVFRDPNLACRLAAAWETMSVGPQSLRAEELLLEAFARLSARDQRRSDLRAHTDVELHRVRDYLHEHLSRRVTLEELASVAGMSRFRLTRRFERAFGLPLHAYHVQARLHEVQRRLRSGARISTVAHELGFADQSHMHRRFKGAFGVTPGEWMAAGR